jgi:hypothetical protein
VVKTGEEGEEGRREGEREGGREGGREEGGREERHNLLTSVAHSMEDLNLFSVLLK